MFAVEVIGERHRRLVPGIPFPGLVAAEQQDGVTTRVEREQGPRCARSQFLHVRMTTAADRVDSWTPEPWAVLVKQLDRRFEFVRVLDFPH